MPSDDWRAGPTVEGDGGVRLATWDLGGDGPPLVLLHATGFHARMWLPLAPVLRATHHVWAYDQRGHGASGHPVDGDYRDWSVFAEDLLAVVDQLELRGPGGLAAAGHSLGGAVLLLAEQRRPGLFGAAYCYEPIVLSPEDRTEMRLSDTPLSRVAAKRRAGFASRSDARRNYASKPPFAGFDPAALDAYVDHAFVDREDGSVTLACTPLEEASVYEGAARHDAWEHLPTTAVPVTIAGGADGAPAQRLPDTAARLPHACLERYDTLSHFGPMEDPTAVAGRIAVAVGPDGGSPRAVTGGR